MQIANPLVFPSLEEVNAFPHGWDVEFYALKSGLDEFRMERKESTDTVLSLGHFNGPTLQLGSTPVGMQTFALPQQASGSMSWHRQPSNANSLMVFGDDRELHATSDAPVSICTISIMLSVLEDLAGRAGLELPCGAARMAHVTDNALRGIYEDYLLLADFLSGVDEGRADFQLQQSVLEEQLHLGLIQASQAESDRVFVNRARSYQLLHAALDYIIAQLGEPLRITALAQYLGISVRTLELCFKKHLGVPPKRAINQLRLSATRRDLLRSSSAEQTVTAIADRWGFWHLGQFSADYRRAFGESPSESLARSASHRQIKDSK